MLWTFPLRTTVFPWKDGLKVVDNIGKTVIHSEIMAIARLIARQHRMMGQSDEDYYRVERIIGQCMDLVEHRGKIHHAGGEEREKLITEFKAEIAPRLLESICRSLKESDGLFVTGNTPSLGDLGILTALDQVAEIDHNMSQCQFLNEHRAAVLKKFPKLAEYVRNRPITTVWSA
ncbi:unnamed protein product [Calicophoron daubneyi]|uniref:GST C-terminal domain-containing protein n=1 Tax=Calicophoron daubneyi TaxID=300641 RepID=A0AAV2T736_CALDB